ncbi:MAG: MarR family protein [Firmicutes bacterium]|nr:MarR family protein [Bacillota bacterium]
MHHQKAVELLFHLMPLLEMTFVRPIDQKFRNILSPLHAHVLFALINKKATMTELANILFMSKQQLTPLVDRLVSDGFVQREQDPSDRRSITVSITSSGVDLLEQLKVETMKILGEKIHHLDETDAICLSNALTDFHRIILKISEKK